MKRVLILILSLVIAFTLGACSDNSGSPAVSTSGAEPQSSIVSDNSSTPVISSSSKSDVSEDAAEEASSNESDASSEPKILIAYFSVPETDGVDAVSGASRVVVDGKVVGNTQFIAEVIQSVTVGNLFEIKTVQEYPGVHDPLIDFAKQEQSRNARPELSTQVDNMDSYDVIFLGYPNWWADLPMPLYTFLEQNDFSGKTIVPFCPHGGSGFSDTIRTIAQLQPKANVVKEGFLVSRNQVANSANDVTAWVHGLDIPQ